MFKFIRKHKLPTLLITMISLLFIGAIVATTAWYKMSMDITPNVTSGIILSYFDSLDGATGDPGSSTNPFVITRPVHYYNLVKLMNTEYDGFDGNNTYFQFGKDLDNSGTNKFYSYGDDGKQISNTYSTSLNMNYYSGTNILSPLGSSSHPFYGHIEGNNLTVNKLFISGKNRSDIGIFGYVASGAAISNLYFDNVSIDLNVMNVNEVNATGHSSHSSNVNFGYIAGHVKETNSFDNVYVNNVSLSNSVNPINAAVKSEFGYFGYCDDATSPNIGEEAYTQSWDAGDVYDFMDSNYGSISGTSLVTRNTEYEATGTVSSAISHNSNHYDFNYSGGKAYSLATAGYQEEEHELIAQYKNGANYNMMTGSSVTSVAPADQTAVGSYVYHDTTNNKWIYYTAVSDGGTPVQTHYNVYYLSYNGITAGTSSTTYYLLYSNGELSYTTTAPTSYASTPNYYFAFVTTPGTSGVSEIRDGTSNAYYIYSPHNDEYLYAPTGVNVTTTRGTLEFGDLATINSSSCEQNQFTISGSSSTEISLDYGGVESKIVGYNYSGGDNSPKFRTTNGQNPALTFTLHGNANTSGDTPPEVSYSFTKTDSSWTPAANDIIAVVNEDYAKAMSSTQNSNNRGSAGITISSDAFVPGASVGRFKLVTYSTGFGLQDVTPDGGSYGYYLCASSTSNNRLTSVSSLNNTNSAWTITYNSIQSIGNTSRGTMMFNHTNSLFNCYRSDNTEDDIVVYLLESTSISIHYEGAIDITESSESVETLVTTEYDIYCYEDGDVSTRVQVTTQNVTSWSLAGNTTYVTIAPDTINGWNLVESNLDLVVGEKYIIACYQNASGNDALKTAGTINTSNHYLTAISSTFNADGSQITEPGEGTYEFILGGNSSDGYTFTCTDGSLYTSNNNLYFTENGTNLWTISISSGTATVTGKNTTDRLQYNSGDPRFKTYSSNQSPIRLYRYDSSEPQFIGDKIGNGYNPDYIDTVGSVSYYSSYMRMNTTSTRTITEANDLGQKFYNTKYTNGGIVLRIPNRGSLDYGTIKIECGANLPVFMKSGSSSITFATVDCDETDNQGRYLVYLNKYNIYQLCLCTLDSSGNINGAYDNDGDEVFSNGSISEFIIVLGAPSSTNVDVAHIDITFSTITGNYGDFGRVGFRSSPDTVPGEIFSFTYQFASGVGSVSNSVVYNSATNTYAVTFTCSTAVTLYIYNYDANRARITVNGTPYYGPYNAISIAASS